MLVSQGVKAIIRPPRQVYQLGDIPQFNKIPGYGQILRIGFAVVSKRGYRMYGSFYEAPDAISGNPVVFYLHGNASNQLEGRFAVSLFVPLGISVSCFDFIGCGASEGDYVTLGHFEVDDTNTLIEQICDTFNCTKFAIWGRSMGAATAILYAAKYKTPKAIVADSSFTSLVDLAKQIAKQRLIPESIFNSLFPSIKEQILKQLDFDVDSLDIIEAVKQVTIPITFIHGEKDNFINPMNSQILYSLCPSNDKNLKIVKGSHNTDRSQSVLLDATTFICHHLGLDVEFEA
ncbi:Clan SC, family S9, unassigned serine peptidase [Trichomonas vaginalis G3]|uniref:Clan SC, family S9, unassigned serine peptidase n=1 Tax=Trichomonas vaginalis (strain ATCC PRA-98 / G3) TaxID=412133 RepID=A2G2E3_TRIV3|nr:palmitoyl-(protein) hydrolase protein [Trichomonas vaginalis G3]EAX88678.1 Clan SC, family S9, unassigned serine peptidase [Trichomonas vaginalis G3]KAI5530594.1 palmitoyl-(protein) hydrolase protein [Trichomonas vaginalis G3]|eukprot:XP_001301608.1 Clan SC, family S9, unassigned serine peptidase [Trichomonas vaginalis G3]